MLRRRTPLRRTSPVRRRRPLSDRPGARRRRFDSALDAARPLVSARSGGNCEAEVDDNCRRVAELVHHIRGRYHPEANDPGNLLDVCVPCHLWIHEHPEKSRRLGFMLSRIAPIEEP